MHCRPSELLGIKRSVPAFYLDRVVVAVGTAIDGEIQYATKNTKTDSAASGKAQLVLNRWLRSEGKARYREPSP